MKQLFTHVKRGYSPEEVDSYIATLEQVVKSYKDKDNAIKNALISAQVAADNILKNAKIQANDYKMQIAKELERVSVEVGRQRTRVKEFQDVYTSMVNKYLKEENVDIDKLYSCIDDVDNLITHFLNTDMADITTPGGK